MTECPYGVTQDELAAILGDRLSEFNYWMRGQTMTLCDGVSYHYDREHSDYCGHAEGDEFTWKCGYTGTGYYENTPCWPGGHGPVVYRHDLDRFQLGLPIID